MQLRSIIRIALTASTFACTTLACSAPGDELVPVEGTPPKKSTFALKPDVVEADQGFSDAVTVAEDGTLTIPGAEHANILAKLAPGKVVYGNRANNTQNPMGFLGRVESVETRGDDVVVHTRKAGLDDVFASADIWSEYNLHSAPQAGKTLGLGVDLLQDQQTDETPDRSEWSGSKSFGFKVPIVTGGLELGNDSGGSAGVKFSASVGATFAVNPSVSFHYLNHGVGSFESTIGLPWSFTREACLSMEGELKKSIFEVGMDNDVPKLIEWLFPLPPAGGVPLNARVEGKVVCAPQVSGGFKFTSTAKTWDDPSFTFGYDGEDVFAYGNNSEMRSSLDYKIVLRGSAGVGCELELKLGIYTANSLGAFVTAVPRAESTWSISGDATVQEQGAYIDGTGSVGNWCRVDKAGIKSDVGLEAEVLSYKIFKVSLPVFEKTWELSNTCVQPDSCARRTGWHCSDINPHHAYQCTGGDDAGDGTTAGGYDCQEDEYCQIRVTDGKSTGADMDGDHPRCGPQKPAPRTDSVDLACNGAAVSP